jgi:hyperosmotically inducible protein
MTRIFLALIVVGLAAGCSPAQTKSSDVSASIRTSLDQAGIRDVSVSKDRDKGVVTLGGHTATEGEKAEAQSIAKSIASGQVVANEVAVVPLGGEQDAKTITAVLDIGIEKTLDAALIQNGLRDGVKDTVTTGVVTLTGDVPSQAVRTRVEKVAADVPNVKQVVNKLDVKNQKATSR